MSAIINLSDLVGQLTTSGIADSQFMYKSGLRQGAAPTAPVIGRWTSLWMYDGAPGGASSAPTTTPDIPTNTTAGSQMQNDPGGGRQKWLLGASMAGLTTGTVMIYDRLMEQGGLGSTTITPQTVSGVITRYTNGIGNQIWAEIYTQIGANSTTISCIYKNQSGNTSTSQLATFGNTGFREQDRWIQIPLASGDTGVQQVTSVTVTATTGTAGSFGITVAHPLTYVYLPLAGVGSVRDLISGAPGIVEVVPGACIAYSWLANTTTIPQLFGLLNMVEK